MCQDSEASPRERHHFGFSSLVLPDRLAVREGFPGSFSAPSTPVGALPKPNRKISQALNPFFRQSALGQSSVRSPSCQCVDDSERRRQSPGSAGPQPGKLRLSRRTRRLSRRAGRLSRRTLRLSRRAGRLSRRAGRLGRRVRRLSDCLERSGFRCLRFRRTGAGLGFLGPRFSVAYAGLGAGMCFNKTSCNAL